MREPARRPADKDMEQILGWVRTALAVVALAGTVALAPAHAQSIPAVPGVSGRAETAAAGSVENYSIEDVRAALAAAKKALEEIEAGGETPSDAPPGTPLADILQRLTLARTLASTYEKQLNSLEKAEAAKRRLAEQQRASEAWRGFEQPPPYSVLLVDDLRGELAAARNALASAKATSALFDRLESDYASRLKAAQGAARLAAEAADRARGTSQYPQREWERGIASLRAAVDGAVQGLLQIGMRGAQAEVDAANATADLATRKLNAVGANVELPQSDLDKLLAEIESRRKAAEKELERALKASATAADAVSRLDLRMATARTAAPAGAPAAPETAELERDLAAAREAATTASQRVFLLREYLLQLDSEKLAWEARASAISLHDPVRGRAAYDRLTESLAGLRATRQYLEQQLATTEGRLRDEEARQRAATHTETPASRLLIETLRQRQQDLRKALDNASPLERLVAHFRADFEDRRAASFTARFMDQAAAAGLAARELWNFELFAIDDSFETAEGRKLAVSRSVTVGKTFGAALIVLVGYWLSRFVVRRIERKAVAAGRATPQGAALVRKWILFAVAAILGLVALVSASIPLTAFAFLGGALAIAAGFGLQTLLKNLVSGVMLLIERPLRLGDLVEVDGIRGRITEIGIRASTIRSADGIESMIPNSRFLEGNMTNWTYSSPQARQTIAIGVAYGSPLRKVAELLAGVMERHGLVLKDPAPQVYLEEYADNSINFSMTYWVEMTETGDTRRIKSDLLLMIDRAFADEGIAIPFPQRDVHLSTTQPVPVEIVGSAGMRTAA
jgi:small-conductance mechanosensitive channel